MKIQIVGEQLIQAPSPVFSGRMPLSDNDCSMPYAHFSLCYIFTYNQETAELSTSTKLIESLSQMLNFKPEYAGRLQANDDGSMAVDCNNTGALWIEATADMSFSEWKAKNFDQEQVPDNLSWQPTEIMSPNDPLFAVQRTQLTDEAVCLTIVKNHSLSDAAGLFRFVAIWAKLHRGETIEAPSIDRTPLNGDPEGPVAYDHPEFRVVPMGQHNQIVGIVQQVKLTTKVFYFSKENVNRLKRDAQPKDDSGTIISTNDAFCALMWRAVTRAKIALGSTDGKFRVGIPCDGRLRLKSLASCNNYMGNAVYIATFAEQAQRIVAPEQLSYIAASIRRQVSTMSAERLVSANNWLAQQRGKGKVIVPALCGGFLEKNLAVTSQARVQMYDEADFGFGPVRQLILPFKHMEAIVSVIPAAPESGYQLQAVAMLQDPLIKQLCEDEELINYST